MSDKKSNKNKIILVKKYFEGIKPLLKKYYSTQNIIILLLVLTLAYFIDTQNQNNKIIENQNSQIEIISNELKNISSLNNNSQISRSVNSTPNISTNVVSTPINTNNPSSDISTDIVTTPISTNKSESTNNTESSNKSSQNRYLVTRVIDGDTFEIEGRDRVRMIGIDTPETVNPNTAVQCYGKEASTKTKELIENKYVTLQKDISETDRYGRLLRYVFIDELFINDFLVQNGFATVSTYPPDVEYVDIFSQSEKYAKENNLGLWSDTCTTSNTSNNTTNSNPSSLSNSSYTCNCSKSCGSMSSCEEAMFQLNTCGCSQRDGDSDGIPCESICK